MGEAELLEYKDREQELPLEEHMHSGRWSACSAPVL